MTNGIEAGATRWVDEAKGLYEQAVFGGDPDAVSAATRLLDGVEADLALARGRILHATFLQERAENPVELELFERAAQLYSARGNGRAEGEALFWVGTFHQVVRGDHAPALPALHRALTLATEAGDKLTLSYVVRHLAFADADAGQYVLARERFEQSILLRREIGFLPGVAAGLLALAEFTLSSGGSREEALQLLDEAESLAESTRAAGILHWVRQARAAF
jgi:tetratricopeptide (TPR) repeat protein